MLSLIHQLQHLLQVCFSNANLHIWIQQAKAAIPIVLSLRQSLQNRIKTREAINPSDLQTLEAHCHDWLNGIAEYGEGKPIAVHKLDALVTEWVVLYTLLHRQYSNIPFIGPVPELVKQYHSHQCMELLQQWREGRGNVPVHAMYDCCVQIVVRRLENDETLYFEQMHRVCQLIKMVTRLDCPTDSAGAERLLLLLLSENCNDPIFIAQAFDCWVNRAQDTQSLTETLEYWLEIEQHILIWQQEQKPALYPHKQGCGAALLALVQKEREKLQLWQQPCLAAVSDDKLHRLNTRLTLSELAIIMRLLQETGVLQHRVMMDYFRSWAQWVQTGTNKPIAAESLKSRYYQPEPSALRKVKDLLLEMRNKLAEW
ncbi:hypothetical protein [Hydrotalea sp.]|uniref:hypothetical protein n=1 Tax=Hydrotalea sp. TaxID=2881279 RepID=UPI003D1249F7